LVLRPNGDPGSSSNGNPADNGRSVLAMPMAENWAKSFSLLVPLSIVTVSPSPGV
jgi:hypothetical protein